MGQNVTFTTFAGSTPYVVPATSDKSDGQLVHGLTMLTLGDVAMVVANVVRNADGDLVNPGPSAWETFVYGLFSFSGKMGVNVGFMKGTGQRVKQGVDGVIVLLPPQTIQEYPTLGRWKVLLAEGGYLTGGAACCFASTLDAARLFSDRSIQYWSDSVVVPMEVVLTPAISDPTAGTFFGITWDKAGPALAAAILILGGLVFSFVCRHYNQKRARNKRVAPADPLVLARPPLQ
jgi:hypothetical protein